MINKRVLAVVMVLVLGISAIGCSGASKDPDKVVVAKVNGEDITKGEFNLLYEQIKQNYMITEEIEDDPEQKETIMGLKLELLDQLIGDKLLEQKAKEAGFVLDEKAMDRAKEEYENIIGEIAAQMEAMEGDHDGEDSQGKDYKEEARGYLEDELNAMDQTLDDYLSFIGEQMVLDDYLEDLLKDIDADDKEIKSYYDEKLKSQKEDIASIGFDDVELYSPVEARVKHILIKLPEDELHEYEGMVVEGKEEEAKEYLNEKLKGIEPKALEVLELARSGESFEELIDEYGEDPGMVDNEAGYIVRQDGDFMPEFEEAAFKLEDGEISDPVSTAFGYHIIKLYEKVPEREYSLEEKKDEIGEIVREQKKVEAFRTMMDGWLEEAKIKKYDKRL